MGDSIANSTSKGPRPPSSRRSAIFESPRSVAGDSAGRAANDAATFTSSTPASPITSARRLSAMAEAITPPSAREKRTASAADAPSTTGAPSPHVAWTSRSCRAHVGP